MFKKKKKCTFPNFKDLKRNLARDLFGVMRTKRSLNLPHCIKNNEDDKMYLFYQINGESMQILTVKLSKIKLRQFHIS